MINRESYSTVGWTIMGIITAFMIQLRSLDNTSTPDGSRRLAGADGEYSQALRPISTIFSQTADETSNGIPGTAQLISSTAFVLILGSLAAGAGIGGGGLFVPIYMVLLGAGPKGAVPLSKATILGAAVGNFFSISTARHPRAEQHKQADRPLIDYEASTFMQR